MSHNVLFVLSFCLHMCIAAFTKPARWSGTNLIIQKNSAGTWCFLPVAGETTAIDCKGDHADLQGALNAHMQQDSSIAYYNAVDNAKRGGATWSLPTSGEIIRLCASGKGGDGVIQTICSNVDADDKFTGTPYCEVALGPRVVSDGCYTDTQSTSRRSSSSTTSTTSSTTSSAASTTSTSISTSSVALSSKRSSSTSLSGSPILPSVIRIESSNKSNWPTEIFVPIFTSILGLIAAVVGARLYTRRRRNTVQNVGHP